MTLDQYIITCVTNSKSWEASRSYNAIPLVDHQKHRANMQLRLEIVIKNSKCRNATRIVNMDINTSWANWIFPFQQIKMQSANRLVYVSVKIVSVKYWSLLHVLLILISSQLYFEKKYLPNFLELVAKLQILICIIVYLSPACFSTHIHYLIACLARA